MTLPVFLVHFDAPEWVRSATDSILKSNAKVRVFVVNNGPQRVLNLDDRVIVIDSGFNAGYAGGANIALRHWLRGKETYCLIGSHDLHVEEETIERLVAAADREPRYGMLGPILGQGVQPGTGIERLPINGTAILFRRDCVRQIGGYDEDFGSYGEDEELCVRAERAGWQVGRVLDSHAWGLGSASPQRNRLCYGNMLVLAHKTLGPSSVLRGIGSHLKRAGRAIVRGDWVEARDRLAGLGRGLKSLARIALGRSRGVATFDES